MNIVKKQISKDIILLLQKIPSKFAKKYKNINITYCDHLTFAASVDVNKIIYILKQESFYQ